MKCVLRLSCVVHGPIYGRFVGVYVNGFVSMYNVNLIYIEKSVYIKKKPKTP